ncbi:MAG: hypothetical protein OXG72_15210 [Acidobacteria bacterium]|nr:hypothetical protein [Acidobacteriota bacterium]
MLAGRTAMTAVLPTVIVGLGDVRENVRNVRSDVRPDGRTGCSVKIDLGNVERLATLERLHLPARGPAND